MDNKMKQVRERAGKTQEQVARESGIRVRQYQAYEYGKNEPGVRTAIRIAKALGASVEDLFGKE